MSTTITLSLRSLEKLLSSRRTHKERSRNRLACAKQYSDEVKKISTAHDALEKELKRVRAELKAVQEKHATQTDILRQVSARVFTVYSVREGIFPLQQALQGLLKEWQPNAGIDTQHRPEPEPPTPDE